ncbi:hypothetical protein EVAR_76007_1 [Eumeta japonica]|uniref:Uncharacterized protein n=1 Tax=Eumeta variegata TaxID=151549 RepID=A0A4C1UA25_EUMVA|nr:hypothetical protein EVAR_76007_1 [Eumeta japonica]
MYGPGLAVTNAGLRPSSPGTAFSLIPPSLQNTEQTASLCALMSATWPPSPRNAGSGRNKTMESCTRALLHRGLSRDYARSLLRRRRRVPTPAAIKDVDEIAVNYRRTLSYCLSEFTE